MLNLAFLLPASIIAYAVYASLAYIPAVLANLPL